MDINAILNLAKPFVDWTYDKRMTVFGSEPYEKPDGSDGVRFGEVLSNVPCRVSMNKRDNTTQADGNLITNSHILFCASDVLIPAGSKLTVDGIKYESTEAPMVYPSHQEIKVNQHEWA